LALCTCTSAMQASPRLRSALQRCSLIGSRACAVPRRAPSTNLAAVRPLATDMVGSDALFGTRSALACSSRRAFAFAVQQAAERSASAQAGSYAFQEAKESPLEMPQKELDEVQDKIREEKHSLLLALADFENKKKKYASERESRRRTAMLSFAQRLSEVYDQFDELAHSRHGEACQALQEGIGLTRNLYKGALEKFDVEPLSADIGSPCVADRHEVIGSVQDSRLPIGSIGQIVRPGWVFEPNSSKPTLLRRAQVRVVKALA